MYTIAMRLFLFLFFVFFPMLLPAQSDFLKDPDIVWAVELEQDWVVETSEMYYESFDGIKTLKLLQTEQNEAYWLSPFLPELVFHAVLSGKLPIFKDSLCQVPADIFKDYLTKDTVLTFDPETYDEKTIVVQKEIHARDEFKCWRLRQVLAYHKKSGNWSCHVQSIAPMVVVRTNTGDSIGFRPLFWFRPEEHLPNINAPSIVWAKEMKSRTRKTVVNLDDIRLLKVTEGEYRDPIHHQYTLMEKVPESPFYKCDNSALLTAKERNSMLFELDTFLLAVNDDSFGRNVECMLIDFDPYLVNQLQLVQNWYWDEQNARLSIRLKYVVPLRTIFDQLGNNLGSIPLYSRRAKW